MVGAVPVRQREFQSTHPQGVRQTGLPSYLAVPLFQSTHPQGVRRRILYVWVFIAQFQSTHPQGVRLVATPISA